MLAKYSLAASLLYLCLLSPTFAHARPQTRGGRAPSPAPAKVRKERHLPRPTPKAGAAKARRSGPATTDAPTSGCGSKTIEALNINVVRITARKESSAGKVVETG